MTRCGLFSILHRLALVFPVLTALCVSAGLLFGCRCGSWQWALAAILSIGCVVRQPMKKTALAAAFLLVGLLIVSWVAAGVLLHPVELSYDYTHYHLPAVRLLIEGWNPFWQGRPELIERTCSVSAAEMSCLHVLAMPKGIWYLSAALFPFYGNSFNLLFPGVFFLAVALAMTAGRAFSALPRGLRLLATALSFAVIPQWILLLMPVDAVLAMAAVGLLLTLWRSLKTGAWPWTELLCYSFWMCTGKQLALAQCFVFWCVFAVAVLYRRWDARAVSRLTIIVLTLGASTLLVCASPYLSAWRDYGHPLYPVFTSDPARHPAVNMTSDFLDRNADAAALGRIGGWANAYVSSALVAKWYCWRTGQDAFLPQVAAWEPISDYRAHPGSPTGPVDKALFFWPLLFLLILGRLPERLVAGAVLLGTMAVPTEMLGYIRYVPWFFFGGVLCVPVAYEVVSRRFRRIPPWCYSVGGLLAALGIFSGYVKPIAVSIDNASAIRLSLCEVPPSIVYHAPANRLKTHDRTSLAGLRLLLRQTPALADTRLVSCEDDTPQAQVFRENRDRHPPFYGGSFFVSPDYPLERFSERADVVRAGDPQAGRRRRHFKFRMYFKTLPCAIFRRVMEPFKGSAS